jgi:hypothetical protein
LAARKQRPQAAFDIIVLRAPEQLMPRLLTRAAMP